MPAIYPVATTRVSDLLLQQRVLSQFAYDRTQLVRLQDQISTGYRLTTPSDDAPAAMRALTLQNLIEQKSQAKTNLQTTQSYVSASDAALSHAADLLINVRSQAVSLVNTINSDSQRRAAAFEVQQAIRQMTDAANQEFRGRFLFAGTQTNTIPFVEDGKYISFQGSEQVLSSLADVDLLFESSISGQDVFGAYSSGVEGAFAWAPNLTENTRLADLNGGLGVALGSIRVSDGTTDSVIDLTGAETIRDVVRRIEAGAPAGRALTVRIDGQALDVDLDDAGTGNLTIREVGIGTTASDLGILNTQGVGVSRLDGRDLQPRLNPTTRLADIQGQRATAYLEMSGDNNDIAIEALRQGSEFNDYSFQYVDDGLLQAADGLSAGNETVQFQATAVAARAALTFSGTNNNLILTATTPGPAFNRVEIEVVNAGAIGNAATVSYNPTDRRLTIGIDQANRTQVQTLINAIQAEGTFSAAYDPSDPADGGLVPTAAIVSGDAQNVSGNTGNSGGEANTFYIHIQDGVSTAEQVLDALQANSEFTSRFQATLEGKDTSSSPFAGLGAVDDTLTASTGGGAGREFDLESGIRIVNGDRTYSLTFEEAETVEDVLNVINASGAGVLAEISSDGSRIQVRSRLSGADFQIGENGGTTAEDLGIRSFTRATPLSELNHGRGVNFNESGTDFTITRKDGVQLAFSLHGATTVGDVIDAINNHPANLNPANQVVARLARYGNGIELADANRSAAGTLTLTNNLGTAAVELGWIADGESATTAAAATAAAASVSFDRPNSLNNAFRITAAQPGLAFDGVTLDFQDTLAGNVATAIYDPTNKRLTVNIDASATTASTVVAAIQAEGTFTAALDPTNDPTNDGSALIPVTGEAATTTGGEDERIAGSDVNPLEVEGVFNSLVRLYGALTDFNLPEVERAVEMLNADFDRLNFSRADLGHRQQALGLLDTRMESENIELQSALSQEIDVDFVEAVSNLTSRQANLEATLRLVGRTLQLTLMDYL